MTATSQHGFHPDAESLSAFSDQALGERERADVLAHLAVCGRCREVVALAREAAGAGGEAAAVQPRKTIAPNAWWKQWRLVWVPTAVVAAFAAASISVYVERADRHEQNARIAEKSPPEAPPLTPSPAEQAKVEPPAATAPAPPPAHAAKRTHSNAKEPLPAPEPPVVGTPMPSQSEAREPQAPATRTVDQAEAYREAEPGSSAEAQPVPPDAKPSAMRPAASQPAEETSQAKKNQAEQQNQAQQQRQAETETSRMRSFKARATPFAGRGGNAAPPPSATESVSVAAAPQSKTQTAAVPESAPMLGFKHAWDATTPEKPIQLPSGLLSVSIASGAHFLLAVDEAGALFLSEDRGVTWERITRQWTGRAVEVRRQARDHVAPQAAPAAQNPTTAGLSPNANVPSPPLVSFELSNDENQTWVSTDGQIWMPK